MKNYRRIIALLLIFLLLFTGCAGKGTVRTTSQDVKQGTSAPVTETTAPPEESEPPQAALDADGEYTSKEDVALYLHLYGKLPVNFITKKQAQKLGWESGDLWRYAEGKSIGGDRFGNYEGLLPEDKDYKECDIDYHGGKRNAKRIVFSADGFIYYTGDHYESFELLYGEE